MSLSSSPSSSPKTSQSQIESIYNQGLFHYDAYRALLRGHSHKSSEKEAEREDTRKNAIKYFDATLNEVGHAQDQCKKIEACIRLIYLRGERGDEYYFYTAIELAQNHIGKLWHQNKLGSVLIDLYEAHILPLKSRIQKKTRYIPIADGPLSPKKQMILMKIEKETDKRNRERIAKVIKLIENGGNFPNSQETSAQEIIDCIEYLFGPVRLAVMAEGETLVIHHRVPENNAYTLFSLSKRIVTFQVPRFDRHGTYQYIIDYGSNLYHDDTTRVYTIDSDESRRILTTLITTLIQKQEILHGIGMMDHAAIIRDYEVSTYTDENISGETLPYYDYRSFIDEILRSQIRGKTSSSLSAVEYLQAFAVCRVISTLRMGKTEHYKHYLSQKVDEILEGRVSRAVYDTVTSMLLAQYETMHGIGIPYGITKRELSLAEKVNPIIRAYEALMSMYPHDPSRVRSTIKEWSGGGNFDPDIVDIFIEFGPYNTIQVPPQKNAITPHRFERLAPYLERWGTILTEMDTLLEMYAGLRFTEMNDQAKRIQSLKTIARTTQKIREVAAQRVHFVIKRHETALSDIPGGPAGYNEEPLSPEGIGAALKIGKKFRDLIVEIYTSPLRRSRETAYGICKGCHQCEDGCICRYIHVVGVLTNIQKDIENMVPESSLLGLFARSDLKGLTEFILRIISSSQESMHLIITHADILRVVLAIVNNLFSRDEFSATRIPVGHDDIYDLLFQGLQVIPEWNLLFTVRSWRERLISLSALTEDIFGTPYQHPVRSDISLIDLHKRFLDYLDEMAELFPDRIESFLIAIERDENLQNLPAILRKEGFGKQLSYSE